MLKELIGRMCECWKYTHSIGLMVRFFNIGILGFFKHFFGIEGWYKSYTNIPHEYLFTTPFGKYLCSTLNEYYMMELDYEKPIGDYINSISQKEGDDRYLINIGSNIGRWSIGLAKKYDYNVIAFEPVPLIYHQLRTNVVLSNLEDKITTYNVGLGNKNSKMHMEYKRWRCGNSHIVEDNYEGVEGGDIVTVNVRKFDEIGIDDSIIKKTRLIIMDVEGFEYNVIQGMVETLSKLRNISIIMEIHENPRKDDTIKFMEDLGYKSSIVFDGNYLFKK